MQLAGELAGSDPLVALQNRVSAYWNRVLQRRIVASMQGIMASNLASNGGDMVVDISAGTGDAANFNSAAVIDAAATLGDSMGDVKSIFMHSHVYSRALKNDEIEFVQPSQGAAIATYRGMAVVVDDGMPVQGGVYVTALAGTGAFAFGVTAPLVAEGTETERVPSAGNGGGMEVLHSRVNLAVHPAGFDWTEGSVSADSPSPAELRLAANWQRVSERKLVPIAFLLTK